MNNEKQRRAAAAQFARDWKGRGDERQDCQTFWLSLLSRVFGVENPETFIEFEKPVTFDGTQHRIDAYISSTRILIEQKSLGRSLQAGYPQSGGLLLTPYDQARRYVQPGVFPVNAMPLWIITCNFAEFRLYNMNKPNEPPYVISLANLERQYGALSVLVGGNESRVRDQKQVSLTAGQIVAQLYDAFAKQYLDPDAPETMQQLNILCVRLVFCLYAEDAGVFGEQDMFHDFLAAYPVEDLRNALLRLFEVLDTPTDQRDPYLDPRLAAFPYVNGGLFHGKVTIPRCTPQIRTLLLQNASLDFNWADISPTIFGALFESTLNPQTRHSGGMHYTSPENIHKVIDPLFLDNLTAEFETIKAEPILKLRSRRLQNFQNHLATLVFFDPACGSGNFLTETYLSLRRLENQVIAELLHGQTVMGEFVNPIRVSISQFYGIEINDFAVSVATTALWISESQMLAETEQIVQHDIDFLPLHSYTNIHEANALRIPWEQVVPPDRLSYIIGNPPFSGARVMTPEQKADLLAVFGTDWKNVGNMDYVSGWYLKAVQLLSGTRAQAALVSTNSITQGEQVANLWQPLMDKGIVINFAHRTFRWDSEATQKAHVHCVIVGFSFSNNPHKYIFDGSSRQEATHINAYLADADDVFIYNRSVPICANVPEARSGNKPIDGGNYLFTREEMDEFIAREPLAAQFFRPWYGAEEFIHRKPRYCLWLGDCTPAQLRAMPHALKRVEAVRNLRLKSKSAGTRKLADRPTHFHVETIPQNSFLVLPLTSSERRKYVPIGFMQSPCLASNLVIVVVDASLYHFGVLTSNVFMAWMRTVCGRLKSDYRITKDNVYNNFPWPSPTPPQQERIESTAQAILAARNLYPDSSLADLYDPLTMPPELLEAHRQNDRAVMQAYGFPTAMTEPECVAALFQLYKTLTQ